MSTPQRAAIYARVSSTAQRNDQTIRTQLDTLRPYAALRGMKVVSEYIDDGRTAKAGHLGKRDGLARLFADAKARLFDVLLVIDVDRLTRSADAGERGHVLAQFQRANIPIITPSATYDMGSSTGDLLANLAAWKAQEDNRIRSERTIDGHMRAAREGRKPRGPTPIGLRYHRDEKRWSVDPLYSEVIREVFDRLASGDTCSEVARVMQQRGVRRSRGGQWTDERVRTIVRSDVYLGRFLVDRGRGLSVPVPVFVDPDVAHEARARVADRYRKRAPPSKHTHLLNRLARCSVCQSLIILSDSTLRGPEGKVYVPAYLCSQRKRSAITGKSCTLPRLRVERADELVWSRVVKAMTDPRVFDQALAMLEAEAGERPDPSKHERELARLDHAADAALSALARGEISQAVADAQVTRLAARRKAESAALLTAKAAVRGLRSAAARDTIDALVTGWRLHAPHATPEQRRALLEESTTAATVGPEVIVVELSLAVQTLLADGPPLRSSSCSGARVRLAQVTVSTAEIRRRRAA